VVIFYNKIKDNVLFKETCPMTSQTIENFLKSMGKYLKKEIKSFSLSIYRFLIEKKKK